jgi:hypothetical protein
MALLLCFTMASRALALMIGRFRLPLLLSLLPKSVPMTLT